MKRNAVIFIVVLIALVLIMAGIALSNQPNNDVTRDETGEEENRPEQTINTKHQYKDGEHVFVGTLELPTPCHSYSAAVIPGDTPEIRLTTSAPEEDTVCAQVITEKDFKVTYASDNPDLEFDASLNGEPVSLNIFEVSPEEDIDTVELFIKG